METPQFDFESLTAIAKRDGAKAAVDHLIADLQDGRDPTSLFYAQLLKARLRLGVSPYPTGSAHELPPAHHEEYENAIRDSARATGRLLLSKNDIGRAWPFFRLINEPGEIQRAIESYTPGEDEDVYPVIDVAWHQGVAPRAGFDLMIAKQGICSTITLLSQSDLSKNADIREYALSQLVKALHSQLKERIIADLQTREIIPGENLSITALLDHYPELTAGEGYHIDLSHLQSVVQMGTALNRDPALGQLRELCDYGRRLASGFAFTTDPPFENGHVDYLAFYNVLAKVDTEKNLEHFQVKAREAMKEGMTYPTHVVIDLLTRTGRLREAFEFAREQFAGLDPQETGGPSLIEMARGLGDHAAVAIAAKEANDPVAYLAATAAIDQSR